MGLHAHCTIGGSPQSDSVIICLSLVFVANIHGLHCRKPLPLHHNGQKHRGDKNKLEIP